MCFASGSDSEKHHEQYAQVFVHARPILFLKLSFATTHSPAPISAEVIAKLSPHVLDPVLFALHLGIHFVTTYPHIHKSNVTVEKLKWSRIVLEGAPEGHNHSFVRDGEEKETVDVWVDGTAGTDKLTATIKAGLKDLLG